MTLTTDTARDVSRFLQTYAKGYHAGAFATPTAKELADPASRLGVVDVDLGPGRRTVVVTRRLTRNSVRADYTGRSYGLPAGALLATHIGRDAGAPVPAIEADYVMAYAEDRELSAALAGDGRAVLASRVTAAAEVINVWGPGGQLGEPYPDHDLATVTRMGVEIPRGLRSSILNEVLRVSGWDDDFPYYSDGSWSSLSLRGFYPEDPARGVKPSEMPKSWKAENPADLGRRCDWTVLTKRVPTLRSFVESVGWWGKLERLRLLQMSGRGGKGGKLGRHTDITDRDSGTRNGQITRFHVPLVTHPEIRLHTWDLDGTHSATHLREWGCYYLDARKPHAVVNPTGVDRIHLVADVVTDAEVRSLIGQAYRSAR